jgi:3-oxoacyl-[acyl-carrier protein] reductase
VGALAGTVAIVTGADQPLGRGLALALAESGAHLGLIGTAMVLAEVTTEVEARGHRAVAVEAAVTDRGALERAFATAADELDAPVRAVLHAAMTPTAYEARDFEDVDDDHFEAVWEHTMRAALAVLQASFTTLRGEGGRIVVVTPTIALSGAPRLAPYAMALEAQRLLAKSAARQWGTDGIVVNCLAPAPDQVPIGVRSVDMSLAAPALAGPGDPETDLGPVATFLASDAAHYVSGVTVCVDGGVWMAP